MSWRHIHILRSDSFPTAFHLSSFLSFVAPLPPCLPPEIITTSFVKISLYLNSWISEALDCWQSLFNNSKVRRYRQNKTSLAALLVTFEIWLRSKLRLFDGSYRLLSIVMFHCGERNPETVLGHDLSLHILSQINCIVKETPHIVTKN